MNLVSLMQRVGLVSDGNGAGPARGAAFWIHIPYSSAQAGVTQSKSIIFSWGLMGIFRRSIRHLNEVVRDHKSTRAVISRCRRSPVAKYLTNARVSLQLGITNESTTFQSCT